MRHPWFFIEVIGRKIHAIKVVEEFTEEVPFVHVHVHVKFSFSRLFLMES